jgi:hypothetical protein
MYRIVILLISIQFSALSAPFDLNSQNALHYAKESLQVSDFINKNQLVIRSATDTLNLTFLAGFGISVKPRYIRLDVINGAFNTNFPLLGLAVSADYTTNISAGGVIGDTFLIIEVNSASALGADTSFLLESDSFIIYNKNEPLKIQYTLYDSASDAVNHGRYLSRVNADLAKVISAVGVNFTSSFSHSVGFSQDFLRFNTTFRTPNTFELGDASPEIASLGKVIFERLIMEDTLLPSNSVVITDFRLLIPEIETSLGNVIIDGDFSTARFFLNADDDCAGASTELAEYSSSRTILVSIDQLIDFPVFCIAAESNEIAIQRSSYQIDLDVGTESKLLGEVIYDAATIDLPYITDYSDYRQRIILVNHAGYDVRYFTEFTSELEVADNYSINDLAKGVIPAGSTLKLNANDLVTISEGVPTRVSARILVDAKPKDISAAIQILSLGSNLPPITNVLQVIEY